MKKVLLSAFCAVLMICMLILSACGTEEKPDSRSFQAMDTLMTLTVYGDGEIGARLEERIDSLDRALDATDEKSEVYRLNREKTASVSADTADLLSRSLALCEKLGGSFDITVCPAVNAWGFTTGEYRVPDKEELERIADRIDYRGVTLRGDTVTLPDDGMLDLGAVAKGYAADRCRELLADSKAQAAVLNLGGTVALYGQKPDGTRFKVGVADPENPAGYIGTLSADGGVIATSGGYERYFERDGKRYIHILDPATAAPVENGLLSVSIVCESGTDADALSTALFVMGLDRATAYYRENGGFDFIILTDSGGLYLTEGVFDDFTLADGYGFTLHKVLSD